MELVGRVVGGLFEGYLAIAGGLSAGGSLLLLSVALGVVMVLLFKWWGDAATLERAVSRMQAHMMEMRLFDREPRLVFVAMARLFGWNARLVLSMLRPALIAAVPTALLLIQMEHYYGMRPLRPGESVVVTAMLQTEADLAGPLRLQATDGATVETPAVRSTYRKVASWRVRSDKAGEFNLRLSVGEHSFDKSLTVANRPLRLSRRRVQGLANAMVNPVEPRLSDELALRWIDIRYPRTNVTLWGLELHWMLWLVLLSLLGGLGVRMLVNRVRPNTL